MPFPHTLPSSWGYVFGWLWLSYLASQFMAAWWRFPAVTQHWRWGTERGEAWFEFGLRGKTGLWEPFSSWAASVLEMFIARVHPAAALQTSEGRCCTFCSLKQREEENQTREALSILMAVSGPVKERESGKRILQMWLPGRLWKWPWGKVCCDLEERVAAELRGRM